MKIRWLIGILPLLFAAGLLPGQTSAQRGLVAAQDDTYFAFPVMGNMRWTGNRLAGCEYCGSNPLLWAVDRQGNRESVAFEIPGADHTYVYDVAPGQDGSLTGASISGDSRKGTFIAWISPDATRQVVTRTWPYCPRVVTVAPDGTIWTVGPVMNETDREVAPNVLRHYATSGQLLASTSVRGVRQSNSGMYRVSDISALMASSDRIGRLTGACQYIE